MNPMLLMSMTVFYLFPLLSLIFLICAIKTQKMNFALSALWISLISVLLNYQLAGNEILGSYFNIFNATIYTINLILFICATLYLFYLIAATSDNKYKTYAIKGVSLLITLGCGIVLSNLWINAYFLKNRFHDTPLLQVIMASKPTYCKNEHVFYKINPQARVEFLCPKGNVLFPSKGLVSPAPKYIYANLSTKVKKELASMNPEWQ